MTIGIRAFAWLATIATIGARGPAGLADDRAREAAADAEPSIVGTFPENEADIVRLPDGSLKVFYNQRGEYVGSITSADDGRTWSAPRREFAVTGETAHAVQVLLDRRGELHVFYLVITRGGRRLGVDLFLDLWTCRTTGGRATWGEPHLAYHGAVGALRGLVQTRSGRIVVPFSTADPERKAGPPTGNFYTTALFSDDDGATWRRSDVRLTAPCFEGYNGGNYGAVEPTVVELADGRLWMLVRTQTGRLYESYSADDGATWSPAKPSRFYGSNSPAMLRRLDDGRLLLAWNNARIGPRHEGQGVYGGRDALHVALSADDGRTWRGFREAYRDPTRHGAGPVLRNDRGTAYPDAVQAADGAVVLVTGQGEGRRAIVRFRPEWLTAVRRESEVVWGSDDWTAFQDVGPAQRFYRARREGGMIVAHPNDSARRVLSIGRRDAEPPAGAVWNFPAGRRGALTLLFHVAPGFGGGSVSLGDRMFAPCDDAARTESLCSFDFHGDDASNSAPTSASTRLTAGRHELVLSWDVDAKRCRAVLDGRTLPAATLRAPADVAGAPEPPTFGPSYLAIRSSAREIDRFGWMIERTSAEVEP